MKSFTFLDDVNGLEDYPSEINNFVIYWDEFRNIAGWIDLRNEELDENLIQHYPSNGDLTLIKEYLDSTIYGDID